MKITIHAVARFEHQVKWAKALSDGFKKHGIEAKTTNDFTPTDCDLACFWGHSTLKDAIKNKQASEGKSYLALERGYTRDRTEYASVGFDGPANLGEYCNKNSPPDRFAELNLDVKPWKTDGDYILMLGQVPSDCALRGLNLAKWTEETKLKLSKITDKEVRFRPHPQYKATVNTLKQDLSGASCVITYNSTSGVDAALNGVPAIVLDEASMAWDVAGHSLEDVLNPPRPDRTQWLNDLAYTQWNLEELRSGKCWGHLGGYLEKR